MTRSPSFILLDEKNVAQCIGKSVAWLQRKRWEGGGIPYRKLGRSVRYAQSDVLQWINSHPLQHSTSEPPTTPVVETNDTSTHLHEYSQGENQ